MGRVQTHKDNRDLGCHLERGVGEKKRGEYQYTGCDMAKVL